MISASSTVGMVLLGASLQAIAGADPLPIIDMHLHALAADEQGPPPVVICAPYDSMPTRAPGASVEEYTQSFLKTANCVHPIWSAKDNDTLREESLAALQRYNIIAVTSGEPEFVQKWHSADPKRIIPAIMFGIHDAPAIASLRAMYKAGMLKVLGEIVAQYDGVGPNDSRLEPYWKLAEELDIPVGIHIGPGPPGATYLGITKYRASLSDPLLLEDVLVRHPRLRLYVMHAGWPMIDRIIALLYAHPQVYVDLAVIDYTQPRAEFHRYLQRLVDAGYGKRVMFGSDQMVWPAAIGLAIDGIQSATFLTQEQKRDILHDNAARFLRLKEPPG
jgi:predicted TIM-barrel fold metal-dependent hydrolase